MRTEKTLTRDVTGKLSKVSGTDELPVYHLSDALRVSGPFAGAGVGYRLPFAESFEFRANLMVGAHFAFSEDEISGTMSGAGDSIGVAVDTGIQSKPNLFVLPDVSVGMRWGGFGVGLGLAAGIFVLTGPENGATSVGPDFTLLPGESCIAGGDVRCTGKEDLLSTEVLYSTHVLLVPSLTAGYAF